MEDLHKTRRELRLSPENIQKVVEVALELAGQPPLIPAKVEGLWPDANRHACPIFHLPALSGSWAHCADGLAHPLFSDQVRPFTFDHNLTRGREDLVLVHLNHRLVQMSLRLLRSEVWSLEGQKQLNRIAARVVPDSALRHPAMIAHARLVVIGGDRHRLHEEVIFAGGQLIGGRFQRFGALREMQDALSAATSREPSEMVKQDLIKLWPKNSDSLRLALEARMKERAESLQKTLADRAEKEASDIKTIMTELLTSIQTPLDDPELQQEFLPGLAPAEREQFERNYDALRARVRAIPEEIEREQAAIRARFADPQPRMFPVAVTYLVPEMLAGRYGK